MKIAILSLAHVHASSYARILAGRDDVEVCAADPDHRERSGESGGAELAAALDLDYLADYDAVWRWRPDAVIVCAENTRHRRLVEDAAAHGAHILCEKPLATNLADAEAMVAACRRAGVGLMVAHPVRFSPAFVALRDAVVAGRLGHLVAITGTNNGRLPTDQRAWFVDPELAGGGALTDHSVHVLDLVDELTGGEPAVSVYATANRLLHPNLAVETAGLVSVRMRSGLTVSIDCSWSRPAAAATWGGLTLQLVGSDGIADLDAFAHRVEGEQAEDGALWLAYGDDLDALMLDAFVQAVRTGAGFAPDGASGVRNVAIVAAAYASLSSGQPVGLS